ncbi:MAG: nucleotide exchange factor GrpE [Gammaproteobacteria bacterium]|nr:nucleotide exchange factor GrpE [Gammaproteobacteria bacterium]MDP2348176.1 nucleotide exchange factor GrpE [Gammaproteobacteria bacterium]
MSDNPEQQNMNAEGESGVEENVESAELGEQNQGGDEQSQLRETLQKLAQAETLIMHQKDEVLRVQAEMQNLRRRTEQDVEKAHKFGQERLSTELLAVMDNLERALQVSMDREDEAVKSLLQGVELTLKSFVDCFRKFGIEQIDPLGEPFDPQLHQAMAMQENPDVEPNTVTAVMQKGYTLHGRVIRPAMVMVSRAPTVSIDEKV